MRAAGRLGFSVAAVVAAGTFGCYEHHLPIHPRGAPRDAGTRDAGTPRDSAPPGPLPDCDDPALWRAPADERAPVNVSLPGVCAARGDHPVGAVHLSVGIASERLAAYEGFCWRVVEAEEGSGWKPGASLPRHEPRLRLRMIGYGHSVRVEARSRDATGELLVARSEPFALPPPRERETVEHFVNLWGDGRRRVALATEGEVRIPGHGSFSAEGRVLGLTSVVWLEDIAGRAAVRWAGDAEPGTLELALPADDATLVGGGGPSLAVVAERRAVLLRMRGSPRIAGELTLEEPPDEAAVFGDTLVTRNGTRLRAWSVSDGRELEVEVGSVDELIASGYVRTGGRVMRLYAEEDTVTAPRTAAELGPRELEAAGDLLEVTAIGIWGSGGFVHTTAEEAVGPRVARALEVHGGTIAAVSGRSFSGDAFAVHRRSGMTTIFQSYTMAPCE